MWERGDSVTEFIDMHVRGILLRMPRNDLTITMVHHSPEEQKLSLAKLVKTLPSERPELSPHMALT